MTIGERIDRLVKGKGTNLRQVAIKAEIPYNTLYAIVKRKSNKIDPAILMKIASALDCDISSLISPKEEKEMIINHLIEQLEDAPPSSTDISALDSFADAYDEKTRPGSIIKRYTDFIANHPHLMQTLKDIGIELEIIDWHRIKIKHDYQETEERTSELLSDLESLHESYMDSIRNLFKNNYGFDMSEEV